MGLGKSYSFYKKEIALEPIILPHWKIPASVCSVVHYYWKIVLWTDGDKTFHFTYCSKTGQNGLSPDVRSTVPHLSGYRKQKYFDFEEICSCLRMDSSVDVLYYLMLWGPVIPPNVLAAEERELETSRSVFLVLSRH